MKDDLQNLDAKLDVARKNRHHKELTPEQARNAENMSSGMRAGAEMVAPIIAGCLIGWGLDNWLETKPVFLIIMLLLGVVTGFVNVWRITQNAGSSVGYSELHKRAKDDRTLPAKKDGNNT
ncbi:MAG: AtpZ/AtpI family protein [Alphaproteobacteria bacterium]